MGSYGDKDDMLMVFCAGKGDVRIDLHGDKNTGDKGELGPN
jgi:hypothetical protein